VEQRYIHQRQANYIEIAIDYQLENLIKEECMYTRYNGPSNLTCKSEFMWNPREHFHVMFISYLLPCYLVVEIYYRFSLYDPSQWVSAYPSFRSIKVGNKFQWIVSPMFIYWTFKTIYTTGFNYFIWWWVLMVHNYFIWWW
jgi:hypothetical protein